MCICRADQRAERAVGAAAAAAAAAGAAACPQPARAPGCRSATHLPSCRRPGCTAACCRGALSGGVCRCSHAAQGALLSFFARLSIDLGCYWLPPALLLLPAGDSVNRLAGPRTGAVGRFQRIGTATTGALPPTAASDVRLFGLHRLRIRHEHPAQDIVTMLCSASHHTPMRSKRPGVQAASSHHES